MKNLLIFFLACFANFLCICSYGQLDPEAVCLRKNTRLEIQMEQGVLKIYEHHHLEKIYYRNFEKHSHESIFYSDFDPLIKLEAETLIPVKNKIKSIKVEQFENKDIVQPGIFYGGFKRKDFVFPALAEGTVGKLDYTKVISDPHLLSSFYFNDENILIEESKFSVIANSSIEINYKVFCLNKNSVEFTKENIGDNIVYSWVMKKVEPFHKEKNAPNQSYSAPHILIFIQSYIRNGKKELVLSDVNDLYSWQSRLINSIPKNNDSDINAVVNQLIQPEMSQQEKIRTIFHWVQSNISYIAFENGMAGFIPRSASDVCKRKYGDCKDMANLLKSMLKAAGVEAYHTWIGTRKKPYSYYEVPSAAASNHMICSVELNNELLFLDATNSYLDFGRPSSMIQGKEALVGIDDQHFKITKVPVMDKSQNQRVDSIFLKLSDSGLQGKFSARLTGYKKDDLEYKHLKQQIEKETDFLEDFLNIGNNNISIQHPIIEGLGVFDKPAFINLDFLLPNYQKSVGDRMYVNMNVNKKLPGEFIDPKRVQMLEEDYKYEYVWHINLQIPHDYTVGSLPANTNKSWEDFGVIANYTKHGDSIILDKKFYSNYLYLVPDKFEQWNEMLKAVEAINQQTVIFSKSK
jgi:hypothetical protein